MPWRECSVMDERMRFVARRLGGEPIAELCREFGISRKTGYKIVDRYQECGMQGLTDRSRRPYRLARSLRDKPSALKKCTTASSWSALWIMTWATLIWRRACLNRSTIRLGRKCYPCPKYKVLPMSPGWT